MRLTAIEAPDRQPYYFELRVASLAPDVVVEATWDDYVSGRDPALAAIAGQLKYRRDHLSREPHVRPPLITNEFSRDGVRFRAW